MPHNNHYNKRLNPLARALRNHSTQAEITLWSEVLRAKQMLGYSFLRQRPVANFIADFMCKELKLIIELDGEDHDHKGMADDFRQRELESLGFSVIRFADEEVIDDIEHVARTIEIWIKEHLEYIGSRSSPSPPSAQAPSNPQGGSFL